MKYNIEFSKKAYKDIKILSKEEQRKIIEKVKELKSVSMIVRKGDTKKLKSFKNVYRLIVGNFRVIYSILNEIILIIRVIDRKNLKKILDKLRLRSYFSQRGVLQISHFQQSCSFPVTFLKEHKNSNITVSRNVLRGYIYF